MKLARRKFLKDSAAVVISTEQRVYHSHRKYAGTLDAQFMWRKGRCLFDWKSSVVAPASVGPQTAGYADALVDMGEIPYRNIRRYCVQLMPGNYKVTRLDEPQDFSIFQSCLNIWRFKNAA